MNRWFITLFDTKLCANSHIRVMKRLGGSRIKHPLVRLCVVRTRTSFLLGASGEFSWCWFLRCLIFSSARATHGVILLLQIFSAILAIAWKICGLQKCWAGLHDLSYSLMEYFFITFLQTGGLHGIGAGLVALYRQPQTEIQPWVGKKLLLLDFYTARRMRQPCRNCP